jgi:hypothetical protein
MKIYLIVAVLTIIMSNSVYGQNLVVKKTYHDVYNTKLKAEWQQTANGYMNGYYKEYYPSGKLYIDRTVKTFDVYPYLSINLKWKVYTEAGDLKWSIVQNEKREFQGEQISYMFSGPNLVKRSRAVFESGKLITFELYRKNGIKSLDLNTKSFYKTYNENGELLDNVKIGPKGEFSGTLYQDNNEIVVEVLNGKIQKVYEKNPDPKNGNWNVFRLGNDTLISTAKEADTYFKKYYIDTVKVGLIDKPNINIDLTQYQNNEFGLDFIDPAFLCCALSHKYYYDIKFYDRSFQTFIKEEIRDINTDRLISLSIPGKDIYYHENGKIKKVVTDKDNWEEFDENGKIKKVVMGKNNWQEFDENGNVINSYEIEKKRKYDNNYKFILWQKSEYLRNAYGRNKYFINLQEYKKNKSEFIYNDKSNFKVKNSAIQLLEEEAGELKKLLNSRDAFLNKVLLDGQDNMDYLFFINEIDGNKSHSVTINEDFKYIYAAYVICVNKLNDSLTTTLFSSAEPNQILSPKFKEVNEIDLIKDSEIIDELLRGENLHKTFDFEYTPDSWRKYNESYFIWLKSYRNLIEEFDKAIKINGSKANKKLKDKTNYNEIISIIKSISN